MLVFKWVGTYPDGETIALSSLDEVARLLWRRTPEPRRANHAMGFTLLQMMLSEIGEPLGLRGLLQLLGFQEAYVYIHARRDGIALDEGSFPILLHFEELDSSGRSVVPDVHTGDDAVSLFSQVDFSEAKPSPKSSGVQVTTKDLSEQFEDAARIAAKLEALSRDEQFRDRFFVVDTLLRVFESLKKGDVEAATRLAHELPGVEEITRAVAEPALQRTAEEGVRRYARATGRSNSSEARRGCLEDRGWDLHTGPGEGTP